MLKDATNSATNLAGNAAGAAQNILGDILDTLGGFMGYIKPILAFLAIIIIGGWILKKVMKFVATLLEKAKVDDALEKVGLTGQLKEMGVNITASALITGIITVVAKLVLYMAAINALGIEALTSLMNDVIAFIPNIIVALILIFAGLTISKIASDIISKSAKSLSVSADAAKTIAKAVKIAILVFTAMAALTQLNIATDLIQTLFAGMVTIITLAGGIAFGLGGQDKAKEIIANICKK